MAFPNVIFTIGGVPFPVPATLNQGQVAKHSAKCFSGIVTVYPDRASEIVLISISSSHAEALTGEPD
jgi:hypothetical protein